VSLLKELGDSLNEMADETLNARAKIQSLERQLTTYQEWQAKTHNIATGVMEALVETILGEGEKLRIEYGIIPGYYDEDGNWVPKDNLWGCRADLKVMGERLSSYAEIGGFEKPWEDKELEEQIRKGFLIGMARKISERVEFRRILLRKFGRVT
jgi:hypothetical protein